MPRAPKDIPSFPGDQSCHVLLRVLGVHAQPGMEMGRGMLAILKETRVPGSKELDDHRNNNLVSPKTPQEIQKSASCLGKAGGPAQFNANIILSLREHPRGKQEGEIRAGGGENVVWLYVHGVAEECSRREK